jgi:phosphohistidine phosphatase SixA
VFDLASPASSGGDAISPTRRAATEGGSLRRPSEISHLAQRRSRIVFRQDTTVDSKPKAWEIAEPRSGSSAEPEASSPPAGAEVVFSRETSVAGFLDSLLAQTQASIEAALHQLSNPKLVRALTEASHRGVQVRLLLDRTKFGETVSAVPDLCKDGLSIRLLKGRLGSSSRMHHKFALLDHQTVVTGSYNWTVGSDEQNYENLILLRGPAEVVAYRREFRALWHQGSEAPHHLRASNTSADEHDEKAAAETVRSAEKAEKGFRVYLMRHGQTEPQEQVHARAGLAGPLTAEGRKRISEIAAGLVKVGFSADGILTSPRRPALETAQIVGRVLQPNVAVEPCEALLPEGSLDDAVRFIHRRPEMRRILVVGHEPALSRLAARLMDSSEDANLKLKKGGCCLLSFENLPSPGHGRLVWWLPPRLLRKLR